MIVKDVEILGSECDKILFCEFGGKVMIGLMVICYDVVWLFFEIMLIDNDWLFFIGF